MKKELVVMYNSEEAASIQTVTGWVSRNGHFWGQDEHMARYDGSTHKICDCGEIIGNRLYCEKCADRKEHEKYMAMPEEDWDGVSPLNLWGTDTYFFDGDALLDYCADEGCEPKDLPLVVCAPKFATEIDGSEHFSDDLPEEGELPADLEEAFRVLNEAIRACKTPLCWYPGKSSVSAISLPKLEK
ncbi:MAG TPA: hypothetical protein VIY47_10565 [Ignavibacteriaceae bacterium]